MKDEEAYYIWSDEHKAWWSPEEQGYTENLEEAGLYSYERALNIVLRANRYIDPSVVHPKEAMIPAWLIRVVE